MAGFYLDAEPVDVVPIADAERLVSTVTSAIAAGNQPAPTPTREQYGAPVVAKAAGFTDGATFVRAAKRFAVYKTTRGYQIPVVESTAGGAWTEHWTGDGVEHIEDDPAEAAPRLISMAIRETSQ